MPAGRPKKTKQELRASGNFRADRHQNNPDSSWVKGSPDKPKSLAQYPSKVWDYVIDNLPAGSIGEIDTPMLVEPMEWLEQTKRCRESIKKSDADDFKNQQQQSETMKSVGSALKRFLRISA